MPSYEFPLMVLWSTQSYMLLLKGGRLLHSVDIKTEVLRSC